MTACAATKTMIAKIGPDWRRWSRKIASTGVSRREARWRRRRSARSPARRSLRSRTTQSARCRSRAVDGPSTSKRQRGEPGGDRVGRAVERDLDRIRRAPSAIARPIASAPMSTDHSQPNSSWLEMMKTNASETSRLPSGSIGTGRHSASIVNAKNIDDPETSVRALGWTRAAETAAAATTGSPTAIVARTYQRSRGGSAAPILEDARHQPRVGSVDLRPARAGAARDCERDECRDSKPDTNRTNLPPNHRRPPSRARPTRPLCT